MLYITQLFSIKEHLQVKGEYRNASDYCTFGHRRKILFNRSDCCDINASASQNYTRQNNPSPNCFRALKSLLAFQIACWSVFLRLLNFSFTLPTERALTEQSNWDHSNFINMLASFNDTVSHSIDINGGVILFEEVLKESFMTTDLDMLTYILTMKLKHYLSSWSFYANSISINMQSW